MAEQPAADTASTNASKRASSNVSLTIAIIALSTAIASFGFSAWQQFQHREVSKLARLDQIKVLSFEARSLLTNIMGELHVAQFICSRSSDPTHHAKAQSLALAIQRHSMHSTDWALSHQGQEERLDRIDARLESPETLENEELDVLASEITTIKTSVQDQLSNIWVSVAECNPT